MLGPLPKNLLYYIVNEKIEVCGVNYKETVPTIHESGFVCLTIRKKLTRDIPYILHGKLNQLIS